MLVLRLLPVQRSLFACTSLISEIRTGKAVICIAKTLRIYFRELQILDTQAAISLKNLAPSVSRGNRIYRRKILSHGKQGNWGRRHY